MSTYITLNYVQIQNANCVAGMTYGFPSVTHFLGYVHALSRKLNESHKITLEGCAINCHQYQIHAYKPKGFGEYVFAQTRNPLTKNGKTAPIIEEGKMHLTVSLVIECKGLIEGGDEGVNLLKEHLEHVCPTQKLAGGVINNIDKIFIETAQTDDEQKLLTRKIRRRLLPGFLLLDRSQYLGEHLSSLQKTNSEAEIFDAWLDFSSLKFQAEPILEKGEELNDKTKANWKYLPKPQSGYLVPITTGYRAISEVFPAGHVTKARDSTVPFCFVEAAYGLGEWQSPHRIQNIDDVLWHYQAEEGWYLCSHHAKKELLASNSDEDDDFDFL